ncbi:uncharacterized protein LOC113308390 isoform X2 [Papaver somniferum]|nr:uncharacterized protein LOC113308390 isoform X2 [Papaver somniferum]XP_026412641.1 uncharacterized protein LOC113308390 isoform X2 [Papaver somniferum]
MIYPTGDCKAYDLYLSLFLHPVDWTESLDTGYSFTVTSQTDPSMRLKRELKYNNFPGKWPGDGWSRFMLLSELHDPDKGYIVNHTCVITVEVTCMMNKETKDDDDLNEGSPNKVEKTENETQAKGKEEKSSSEAEEYLGAGQPFAEGNNKVGFGEEKEFEDVGGFSILKTQAPLYRQIWLKYGHIPSTKVMPISLYPVLVMVVKDLMNCIIDMQQCRYVELTSDMIKD